MASAPVIGPLDSVADGELSGCPARPQISIIELDFSVAQMDSAAALSQAHTGTADRAGQIVPAGESGQLR